MGHLCLNCEQADMVRRKKDAVIAYRGHQTTVRALDGWHCPACGEIEFAGKEGERYAHALEKLHLKVDAEEAAELVRIRKKLGLSQRRAAELTGGGVNAFSRYENGKTKPPLALVKLLKVLDRHPELLNEVRTA